MESPLFQIEIVQADGAVVAQVRGELDVTADGAFDEAVELAVRHRSPLVIDLRQTTFLDVTALSRIVATRHRVCDGRVRVVLGRPMQRRLFTLAGYDGLVELEDATGGAPEQRDR